jgi:hypothetical protein
MNCGAFFSLVLLLPTRARALRVLGLAWHRHRPRASRADQPGGRCAVAQAEHPGACHTRATRRGAQGVATVTHGQVGADDQDRRSRRSAAKLGDRTSKLVMRVRFPSSALMVPELLSGVFR